MPRQEFEMFLKENVGSFPPLSLSEKRNREARKARHGVRKEIDLSTSCRTSDWKNGARYIFKQQLRKEQEIVMVPLSQYLGYGEDDIFVLSLTVGITESGSAKCKTWSS